MNSHNLNSHLLGLSCVNALVATNILANDIVQNMWFLSDQAKQKSTFTVQPKNQRQDTGAGGTGPKPKAPYWGLWLPASPNQLGPGIHLITSSVMYALLNHTLNTLGYYLCYVKSHHFGATSPNKNVHIMYVTQENVNWYIIGIYNPQHQKCNIIEELYTTSWCHIIRWPRKGQNYSCYDIFCTILGLGVLHNPVTYFFLLFSMICTRVLYKNLSSFLLTSITDKTKTSFNDLGIFCRE